MVEGLQDPRRAEPSFVADERQMLEGWLDYHRITLLLKCEGLDDEQRKRRPVSTSLLSLHGLVRHMTEVERGWFQHCIERRWPDPPPHYSSEEHPDGDLELVDDASWDDDLHAWNEECDTSRATTAKYDLDHLGIHWEGEVSLRWVLTHMIEEYARHNGHADLIRELIDGAVGD